jgi:hypothetical protein
VACGSLKPRGEWLISLIGGRLEGVIDLVRLAGRCNPGAVPMDINVSGLTKASDGGRSKAPPRERRPRLLAGGALILVNREAALLKKFAASRTRLSSPGAISTSITSCPRLAWMKLGFIFLIRPDKGSDSFAH